MTVIGELNENGSIKTEADECALSGNIVLGEHSQMHRIKDTQYFFRILSDYENRLTPEKRAEIEALAGKSPSGGEVLKGRRGRYNESADNTTPEEI